MAATSFCPFLILLTVLASLVFGRKRSIWMVGVLKGSNIPQLHKYCYELLLCNLFTSITGIGIQEGDLILKKEQECSKLSNIGMTLRMLNILSSETDNYNANFTCEPANTPVTLRCLFSIDCHL